LIAVCSGEGSGFAKMFDGLTVDNCGNEGPCLVSVWKRVPKNDLLQAGVTVRNYLDRHNITAHYLQSPHHPFSPYSTPITLLHYRNLTAKITILNQQKKLINSAKFHRPCRLSQFVND